jgi:hypothetical protein
MLAWGMRHFKSRDRAKLERERSPYAIRARSRFLPSAFQKDATHEYQDRQQNHP